jgi:glycosyltransferase involved in cell wall biosynthesis
MSATRTTRHGRRRVLVASRSQVRVGGRETYVASIVAALRAAGHDVACWFESDETGPDGVMAGVGEGPAWIGPSAPDGGLAAVLDWRPDVVFVNSVESREWERRLLQVAPAVRFLHAYDGACVSGTKTWGVPAVEPCRRVLGPGCLAHYFPRRCGGRSPLTLVGRYRAERERQALLPGYARLLVASAHMRAEYARQGLGDRVRVVPLPVETPRRPMADLDVTPTTLPPGAWRVLYLGRFEPTKGPLVALDAAARCAATSVQPVRLQFSGDGALRAGLQERAARLMAQVPRLQVAFTSWLTREETVTALDASHLLVVPSLWPEPFGMVGVEAARRGVPAVAFDVGGIAEWLLDGVTGTLVSGPPSADALASAVDRTIGDPGRWHRMRQACLAATDRFTMASHLEALEGVFDEMLEGRPSLIPAAGTVDISHEATCPL